MSRRTKAMLFMVACALLWSTGGIFIKGVAWNPIIIAGVRGLISAGVLWTFMKSRGIPFKVGKNSVLAAVGLGCGATLFVAANKLTTAANAIILQFTNPIFILLIMALVFKKKLRMADVITVVVILGGIALLFVDQLDPGKLLGNLLGVGAGVLLAIMFVFTGESASDDGMRMSGILMALLGTFVFSIPFMFLFPPEQVTGSEILCILGLGIFQMGLAYVFFCIASKDCPPLACSLIGALEPLLNPIWVFLFDGEAPGPFAFIGGVVIIATVCLWCIYDSRHPEGKTG